MMDREKIKILITTGIFPPKIGGPSLYAKNLKETFEKMGHKVIVKTYNFEDKLPSGIRHLFFFLKILPVTFITDFVISLDTMSVGLPTALACKFFRKKGIIRIGGDFLWEQYVERTGKKVLFRNFYQTETPNFSQKENLIFKLTKWVLNNVHFLIFSTTWQRDIFIRTYGLNANKITIVENFYGEKEIGSKPKTKTFVASSRNLALKNQDTLARVFESVRNIFPDVELFTINLPQNEFIKKISESYAVMCIPISEMSPNLVLDAIRYSKPFICTREVGIYDRIKSAGIFVNPLDEEEIKNAVLEMLTEDGYKRAKEKVKNFNFVHTWNDIANEFIDVYKKL